VVKNTLALRRHRRASRVGARRHLQRPAGRSVYTAGDAVAVAKALTEFAKTVPQIVFKGGIVGGKPIAANEVEQIAKLPSREELIAKLLFLLQSPIARFVRTLAAIPRDFVVVLDQVAKQKAG
jgi:large subunit ribosomal protein L10